MLWAIHVAEAVGRVLRVQRHVGRAGLEDGEGGDHQVRGTGQRDADPALRSGAQAQQVPGELVGAAAQLRVGQPGGLVQQGNHPGVPGGLLGDHRDDGPERPRRLGVGRDGFAGVGHGELGQREGGRGRGLPGEDQPVTAELGDGGGVEEVGVELGDRREPAVLALLEMQAQLELRGLARYRLVRHPQPRQVEAAAGRVLQGHQGLHQRGAAGVALGGQLLDEAAERHVLVGEGVQRRRPHVVQQLPEGGGGVDPGPQDQGVDEEADQVLQFGALTARDDRAHRDVALAGVAGEDQLGHGGQHHEEAGATVPGDLPEPARESGRHLEGVHRARRGPHGRPGPVRGQLQRLDAVQLLPPVGELPVQPLALQTVALPDGEVRVLDGQRRQRRCGAAYGGRVQLAQFAGDDPHRPAVGDDVVHRQDQDVLRLRAVRGARPGHLGEQDADQRPGRQVEGLGGLGAQQRVQRRRVGGGGGAHRHGHGLVHHLHAASRDGGEGGPQ